jgi:hypothetical protein
VKARARKAARRAAPARRRKASPRAKAPRLERARRTLDDTVPTPPSSLDKAIGVEYQDNEERRSSDKVVERDKHRWELDPASAEDDKERK